MDNRHHEEPRDTVDTNRTAPLTPEQTARLAGLLPVREPTDAELDEIVGRAAAPDRPTPPGGVHVSHVEAGRDRPPAKHGHPARAKPVDLVDLVIKAAIGGVVAAILMTLLGALAGIGPAAPGKAHAAEIAAPAAAHLTTARVSGSTTMWLGMQAVTVSFRVNSHYAGTPHACIHNNGPDAIKVVTLKVNRMSDRGKYLRVGRSQCLTRGWVTVNGQTAVARFGATDQKTGAPGTATLRLGGGLAPVRATSTVASVQAAAGGLAVDGDYGPLTDARLRYIVAHWRSMPGTVARVQRALGVAADGVVGPQTRDALMLLRNATYGRY